MKEIKLSQQGKKKSLHLVTLVDDEDYEQLNTFRWYAQKSLNSFYAVRREARKYIFMHRQLLNIADSKILVDHKDRNGLNNQRSNLRTATKSQNCANRFSKPGTTSEYLGIYYNKSRNKWTAQIKVNGKTIALGRFNNEKDAALKYNAAAEKFHGEFANPNVI